MDNEHERRCLIQSLLANITRKTGRRYERLKLESMDTPSLRELQRLLRDIDTEHSMAIKRAQICPWRTP